MNWTKYVSAGVVMFESLSPCQCLLLVLEVVLEVSFGGVQLLC